MKRIISLILLLALSLTCVLALASCGDKDGAVTGDASDQIEVISGDKLTKGDLIAKAGNSSVGDFTDKPHLHFEILLNDKYVNPEDYIK